MKVRLDLDDYPLPIRRLVALADENGWWWQPRHDWAIVIGCWVPGTAPGPTGVPIRRDIFVSFDAAGRIEQFTVWDCNRVGWAGRPGVRAALEEIVTSPVEPTPDSD